MGETATRSGAETRTVSVVLRVFTLLLTATSIALVAALLIVQVFAVPRLIEIFEDFDAEVPLLTRWVIEMPSWAAIAAGLLLIAGLIGKEFVVRSPVVRLVIDLLIMVALIIATAVLILALFSALVGLTQSV